MGVGHNTTLSKQEQKAASMSNLDHYREHFWPFVVVRTYSLTLRRGDVTWLAELASRTLRRIAGAEPMRRLRIRASAGWRSPPLGNADQRDRERTWG